MMDPAMDEGAPLPSKRPRPNCLIHCSNDDSDSLVTLNDLDSWKTAEIRQHSTVLELANDLGEGEVPNIQYHRKCRSIFTTKKALDSIKSMCNEPEEVVFRKSSREAPSTSRVYDQICIFCEKTSRYKKNTRTREPLVKCLELVQIKQFESSYQAV